MERNLEKNSYPICVDFKFNINSTRNPKLNDAWTRAIRKCKTDMTVALIDDLQFNYNKTKAFIAKKWQNLKHFFILNNCIKSWTPSFKQIQTDAPTYMERKQNQFKEVQAEQSMQEHPRSTKTGQTQGQKK